MNRCLDANNGFLGYIDEKKLFSFITSVTFAAIFVFIYILRAYTFFDNRKIPRAVRPTAPFGNIKDVLFQNSSLYDYLWRYYNRFKRKGFRYGGFYLFLKPGILIVDPVLTATVLSEQECLTDVYKHNKIKNYKLIVDIFNEKNFEAFLAHYNDEKSNFAGILKEKCISSSLYDFFMETSCIAFGFKGSLEIIHTINTLLKERTNSTFFHYFCLVHPLFKLKSSTSELQEHLRNIKEFRKKNDIRKNDIIQGFTDLLNEDKCSLEEAAGELFDIFTENIVNAHSTVLFCLYELAKDEEIQEDVLGEIRRFNKDNKQINMKNLDKLSTLDLVIKETLRKYPPVPYVFKKCTENYKVVDLDLDVPKGTFVFVSVFGIQRDPGNFVDPEKFHPDRFSEENSKYLKPDTYLPFGTGLKNDIGLHFTTIHIKLGLLNVLSCFKVRLNSKSLLAFDSKKLTVSPEEPLPFKFEPLE